MTETMETRGRRQADDTDLTDLWAEFCVRPVRAVVDGAPTWLIPSGDLRAFATIAIVRPAFRANRTKHQSGPEAADEMGRLYGWDRVYPSRRYVDRARVSALKVEPTSALTPKARAVVRAAFGVHAVVVGDLIPYRPFVLDRVACPNCGLVYPTAQQVRTEDGQLDSRCSRCREDAEFAVDAAALKDFDAERLYARMDALEEFEDWLEANGGDEWLAGLSDQEIEGLFVRPARPTVKEGQ